MADLGTTGWLVEAGSDVKKKWLKVQVQEKKSRIARYKQDIEDLKQGRILELECRIAVLEQQMKDQQAEMDAIVIS